MPHPHVPLFVQHFVPTKGVHELVQLATMHPPPELLLLELLLPPELLLDPPLELLPPELLALTQKFDAQVSPVGQVTQSAPPEPQLFASVPDWHVPLVSQHPVQVWAQVPPLLLALLPLVVPASPPSSPELPELLEDEPPLLEPLLPSSPPEELP
jgi:hypothetical protein